MPVELTWMTQLALRMVTDAHDRGIEPGQLAESHLFGQLGVVKVPECGPLPSAGPADRAPKAETRRDGA
jgi:hypothetical protein